MASNDLILFKTSFKMKSKGSFGGKPLEGHKPVRLPSSFQRGSQQDTGVVEPVARMDSPDVSLDALLKSPRLETPLSLDPQESLAGARTVPAPAPTRHACSGS